MSCQNWEEKIALYLYEELTAAERAEVEQHLAACAGCAAAADELRKLQAVMSARPVREASPELQVRARLDLEEALDREESSWRALVRSWLGPSPRLAAPRVATALSILALGFSVGWMMNRPSASRGISTGEANQASAFLGTDPESLRISGISRVVPNPQTGAVRITLDANRQVTLEGSIEDPNIQALLQYAMKSYDNPGIRRDTLEALRPRTEDAWVRDALVYAMRKDTNAGVRLEALQALRPMAGRAEVRQALIEALERDANAGVRVAAVNLLLENADQAVVPVLEKHAHADENPYVRMRCLRALRELGRADF